MQRDEGKEMIRDRTVKIGSGYGIWGRMTFKDGMIWTQFVRNR